MKLQLASCLFLSSQLWTRVSSQQRIVDGTEAEPDRYPYAVSFHNFEGHQCGGSLIGRDTVLTAAHCNAAAIDKAVIGRHNLRDTSNEREDEFELASKIPHPEYFRDESEKPYTIINDIMLVFLREPVHQDIEFIRLNPYESVPQDESPVTVIGWGHTAEGGQLSDVLLEVEVTTISNKICSHRYEGNFVIDDGMVCAADEGKDSCNGDSGGPLFVEGSDGSDLQVGVVSFGEGCARSEYPGVYSRVSTYYDWIRRETCASSSYPPAEFNCDEFAPSPTAQPTTQAHTVSAQPTSSCVDTPGWVDSFQDSCSWYEANDTPGCPKYGDSSRGEMGTAKENCCYCMKFEVAPTKSPMTLSPTGQPSQGEDCWGGFSELACCHVSLFC